MNFFHFISNGENPNPPTVGGCRCSTKKGGPRSMITLTKRHHPPLCPHWARTTITITQGSKIIKDNKQKEKQKLTEDTFREWVNPKLLCFFPLLFCNHKARTHGTNNNNAQLFSHQHTHHSHVSSHIDTLNPLLPTKIYSYIHTDTETHIHAPLYLFLMRHCSTTRATACVQSTHVLSCMPPSP